MDNNDYEKMVKSIPLRSDEPKNCIKAFISGGAICCFAQFVRTLLETAGMSGDDVGFAVSVILILITALLTGLGLFDKIAKHTGAGTAVPITGFANSVVSPAMEFSSEGRILGTGAKMFNLAGPVIVYGCSCASIYGAILYIAEKIF